MKSQRGKTSPTHQAIWGLGFVFLVLPAACDSGEIQLRTTSTDAASSSGGNVGTGGLVEEPPPASGGFIPAEGGAGPMPHDDRTPWPCLVTGACFAFCNDDRPGCSECSMDRDCPFVLPFCDHSIDRCVECLDDGDCERTFGPAFGECSLGLCVQCQRDEQCPPGVRCDGGWCGHCDRDSDCPPEMECFQDRCVPEQH